jgi:hypothetical protein
MTSSKQHWIHGALAVAAIFCALASLVALFKFGATGWTTPLNVLSLLLVFVAMRR